MKHRIQITHLLFCLSLFAFVGLGFGGQAQAPKDREEARDFKIFIGRVQAYVKMAKNLESSLSTLRPAKDTAQIVEHQHALAVKIAEARRDAHQGDIFTNEATVRFRKIIRSTFRGPEGRAARRTIQPEDPSKVIARLRVNDEFPEGATLTTTPRNLLLELPDLPPELEYRFVRHDLTLVDIKARLIVDVIPNVIP
jgi:hypothetical protein